MPASVTLSLKIGFHCCILRTCHEWKQNNLCSDGDVVVIIDDLLLLSLLLLQVSLYKMV